MEHRILVHEASDDVGVAVSDLQPGDEVGAVTLEGEPVTTIKVIDEVPLGHKIALRDIDAAKEVVEYGSPIGRATQSVSAGGHVHVHNLKSLRWS